MCTDLETRVKIDSQLEKFDKAEELFGYSMAIATRDKKQPSNFSIYLFFKFKIIYELSS